MQIKDSDISIIVHGPLSHSPDMPVEKCLTQVRLLYPKSQIIVATWEGEDVSRVQGIADDVVILEKIEMPTDKFKRQKLNINALLSTVQAGLRPCENMYVLKLRSDLCPQTTCFTKQLEKVDSKAKHGLLSHKIRVSNYYTRNPLRVPMLFHLGDVLQFGLLGDMKSLWGNSLLSHRWMETEGKIPDSRLFGDWYFTTSFRVVPEQAIILSWLERNGYDIVFKNVCHNTFDNFILWEHVLCANFNVVSNKKSGTLYPLRFCKDGYSKHSLHTETTISNMIQHNSSLCVKFRFCISLFNQYVLCICSYSWVRAAGSKILDIYCPFLKKIIKK